MDARSSRKVFTLADAHDRTENQETIDETEKAFRRGFYYGISEVIEGLKNGCDSRQIEEWLENTVFDWWQSNRGGCLTSPKHPEPWSEIRERILERDNRACAYCGKKADTVDHIVPFCKGGLTVDSNLTAACFRCNSSKSTNHWLSWYKRKSFFNNTRRQRIEMILCLQGD